MRKLHIGLDVLALFASAFVNFLLDVLVTPFRLIGFDHRTSLTADQIGNEAKTVISKVAVAFKAFVERSLVHDDYSAGGFVHGETPATT